MKWSGQFLSKIFSSKLKIAVITGVATISVAMSALGVATYREYQASEFVSEAAFRSIASADDARLRVGMFTLTDRTSFVLLALDNHGQADQRSTINAELNGFKSVSDDPSMTDLTQVDPRFLIVMNPEGIVSIHSFSIGKSGEVEAPEDASSKLPYTLLNAEHLRAQLLFSKPERILTEISVFLPKTFFSLALDILGVNKSTDKKREAAYLGYIIESYLEDHKFPVLEKAMTYDDIEEVGALLAIRYHHRGILGAILTHESNSTILYKKLLHQNIDQASQEMDYLMSRANEEGLIVHPISSRYAVIYYDLSKPIDPEFWSGYRLDQKEIFARAKEMNSHTGLVPLGIYVVGQASNNLKLIDFSDVDHARKKNFYQRCMKLTQDVAAVFIPFSLLTTISIDVTKEFVAYKIKKTGTTIYSDRVESFSELLMLFESGVADLDLESDLLDVYRQNLPKVVADPTVRAAIEAGLDSKDPDARKSAVFSLISENAYYQRGSIVFSKSSEEAEHAAFHRMNAWQNFGAWLNNPDGVLKLEKRSEKYGLDEKKRKPETTEVADISPNVLPAADPKEKRPVIAFFVDGLRPDRLRKAVADGYMPNVKKYFFDHGVEFNSFVPISNTIPSWSTILTGVDPDTHGTRGTTNSSRDPNVEIENFIDFRLDTKAGFLHTVGKRSNILKRIVEVRGNQKYPTPWLPDFVPHDTRIVSYMPVHDNNFISFPSVADSLKDSGLSTLLYGVLDATEMFDLGIGLHTAKLIRENPGQNHLIINLFAGVDHNAHTGKQNLDDTMKNLDRAMGEVMKAAGADPVLSKAVYVIASDHGMSGGKEFADPLRPFMPGEFEMDNSTFNLHKFFAGDFPGESKNFDFVVGSHKPGERNIGAGVFDIPHTGLWAPYNYTYYGKKKNPGRPGYKDNRTILIEPYGDAQIYAFLLEDAKRDPAIKTTYYRLRHYPSQDGKHILDIPGSLLRYSLANTDVKGKRYGSQDLQDALKNVNGLRPAGVIALSLTGDGVNASVCKLTQFCDFTRAPVLIQTYPEKMAIALTRGQGNDEQYAYFVIKNFNQTATNEITGSVSNDVNDDPMKYNVNGSVFPRQWMTDREILKITKDAWFPTAIYSTVKALTLSPKVANGPYGPKYKAETADFIVYGAYGFHFNSYQLHQSDHGGLSRLETHNSFFVQDDQLVGPHLRVDTPVVSRDVLPTILDYLGVPLDDKDIDGRSLHQTLLDLRK
jgi:hypothetical protein